MKIKTIVIVVLTSAITLSIFQSFAPVPPPFDQSVFEQNPPFVEKIWVQLLQTPVDDNNVIMRLQYEDGMYLPATMNIYYSDDGLVEFHDDGNGPDLIPEDRIYSAYIREDIENFLSTVQALEDALDQAGSYTHFTGHIGQEITDLPEFDETAFQNFEEVELRSSLINGADCLTELKKENSLFITDLSIVEDGARTYNIVANTGNYDGVWTFGHMMKNMANTSVTGVSVKNFMKSWVKKWTESITVNGQTIPEREKIVQYLIEPWLRKARNNGSLSVTLSNWESIWDDSQTPEIGLVRYAPFKLIAIVNRLDLVGNTAYNSAFLNAGETRFIFTLVSVYNWPTIPKITEIGQVPRVDNQDFGIDPNYQDWKGMNVIFEYGNVVDGRCFLKDFAQSWLDLSAYSFGDPNLNDALEAITNTVTEPNTNPNKPNSSAINRIRTNERIFQPVVSNNNAGWFASDWQFRQFQINPTTHLLDQVPLTNTPVNASNFSHTIFFPSSQPCMSGDLYYVCSDNTIGGNLIDFVFGTQKSRVHRGTHNIPIHIREPVITF